jgi:hypothetical protein
MNGTQVLTNFDIFAAAGNANSTAVVQSFANITRQRSDCHECSFGHFYAVVGQRQTEEAKYLKVNSLPCSIENFHVKRKYASKLSS